MPDMYAGAEWLYRVLYTRDSTLYIILLCTGNQCKESNTGLMWSRFLVPDTSLAAAFWANCRGAIVNLGRLTRRAF